MLEGLKKEIHKKSKLHGYTEMNIPEKTASANKGLCVGSLQGVDGLESEALVEDENGELPAARIPFNCIEIGITKEL